MTRRPLTVPQFTRSWRRLVSAWEEARTRDGDEAAGALLDRVLSTGLESDHDAHAEPSADGLVACEIEVIRRARVMDPRAYADAHPDLKVLREQRMSPIEHFCRIGWRWLLSPRTDFDVWWYWCEHLDPTRDDVNPLLHHALVGRQAGLATSPAPVDDRRPPATSLAGTGASGRARRICLFAAFDVDGVIDDYVLAYLRDLSRHADVYYLADGVMARSELARLAEVTAGAWAIPHGRYDFGSYAMLATELVGWDTIEQYDEMLFANDSCYLLRSLDDTFARMDERAADWWGMQVTKRDFARAEGNTEPIPLAQAKVLRTERDRWDPHYRTHISSYLVGFRRRVFTDPGFRHRLGAVVSQEHKNQVILKYEIGISDYLINAGFDYDAFVPELYPFHPLYSSDYFDLVARGFPLLKRNFIGESTSTPDLGRWQERILEHVPDAPVAMFERNLRRVAPADKLARTSGIRTLPDGLVDYQWLLNRAELPAEDRATPRFDHWWAFPVSTTEQTLTGNERAIFEQVRYDPSIRKVVLTRSRELDLPGENVVVLPLASRAGQEHLVRCGEVFVRHGVDLVLPWELVLDQHRVIDVGAGLPVPAAAREAKHLLSPLAPPRAARPQRNVVVTDRSDDTTATAAPTTGDGDRAVEVWATGQPRHAFLLRPEAELPDDLRAALASLRGELAGRRLLLWHTPHGSAPTGLDRAQVAALGAWAERNAVALGVRTNADAHRLAELDPLLLTVRRYPAIEVLLRAADLLVTDDAQVLAERLVTGRPVVVLGDLPTDEAPGPVVRSAGDLPAALDRALGEPAVGDVERYERCRRRLLGPVDDQAAWRVVHQVRRSRFTAPAPAAPAPRG